MLFILGLIKQELVRFVFLILTEHEAEGNKRQRKSIWFTLRSLWKDSCGSHAIHYQEKNFFMIWVFFLFITLLEMKSNVLICSWKTWMCDEIKNEQVLAQCWSVLRKWVIALGWLQHFLFLNFNAIFDQTRLMSGGKSEIWAKFIPNDWNKNMHNWWK